jgi:hypothetical protein
MSWIEKMKTFRGLCGQKSSLECCCPNGLKSLPTRATVCFWNILFGALFSQRVDWYVCSAGWALQGQPHELNIPLSLLIVHVSWLPNLRPFFRTTLRSYCTRMSREEGHLSGVELDILKFVLSNSVMALMILIMPWLTRDQSNWLGYCTGFTVCNICCYTQKYKRWVGWSLIASWELIEGVVVELYCLNSALYIGEWWKSRSGRFIPIGRVTATHSGGWGFRPGVIVVAER